ncbi:MAG: sodium:proton antiporter [Fusobacteriales bacterium]|nr:MAG: sodium:proton antiporter [Fusobacteriales bacterium]
MAGILTIILFAISLLLCIILKYSVIYALISGYFLFMLYGFYFGYDIKKLFKISIKSSLKVKNIIIIFILVGLITALWRASGTIAFIIYAGSKFIIPSTFILLSFILCATLATLIGSALGTSATMGVICITIARAMQINEFYVAGAILSGIYFGDRCSPMATSAHLVCEVTDTNLYTNIKKMIKTSIIPFFITCFIYLLLGFFSSNQSNNIEIIDLFKENYNLNFIIILPALLIIFLSLLKINVKITMFASVFAAFLTALVFQKENFLTLIHYCIYGYESDIESLNSMMKGGGVLSMVNVSLIVGISSSYSGIFEETKMLDSLKKYIYILANKITSFGAILVTAFISSAIACNQSLGIILTNQLCENLMPKQERAIALENTVVLLAGLIPWSIAMAVPFDAIEVDKTAGLFGFYLFLVPLWNFLLAVKYKSSL